MNAPGLRVGVDMVNIRELASMVEASGPTFVDSCWTRAEQAYSVGSIPRLAARWAAKEATMKALGHGIGEIDPLDIEVRAMEGEAPELRLHNVAAAHARREGVHQLALSLTHTADFAVAFVVATSVGPVIDALGRVSNVSALVHGVAPGHVGIFGDFHRDL